MTQGMKSSIAATVADFSLPRYREIPDTGLYLQQTAGLIRQWLTALQKNAITDTMISNYVKKGLIGSPVRKQYSREQIAYLIFIAVAKSVLSLDALRNFIHIQQQTYPLEKAYDYFAEELENLLFFTFELKDTMDTIGQDNTDEKRMLYICIAAVVEKYYLERCLEAIAKAGPHSDAKISPYPNDCTENQR